MRFIINNNWSTKIRNNTSLFVLVLLHFSSWNPSQLIIN